MANSLKASDYIPIRVTTLRGDTKIPFDVYILVAGKQIHYCRSGDSFEGKRLDRLKAKKLRKMYIRPDDQAPYRLYLERNIDMAYDENSDKPLIMRAEIIQGFQQATAEAFIEDLSEESYIHVRSSVQRFTEFLTKHPNAAKAMLELSNVDESITHHGVTVATLSVVMASGLSEREGEMLHLLALGCLLHDMEHYFSESHIHSLSKMSDEELSNYKEHPINGAKRLQEMRFVDQFVVKVIAQHEEHTDGSGFPKGLFETDMDPLVMVAATANAYDRLVAFEHLTPKEALKKLLIDKMGAFPLPYLQRLQNLLKLHQLV